jgi:hypothetical protein
MRAAPLTVRVAGLIAVGALALHQLRYLLAPPAADQAQEHGYLPLAGVAAVLLLALAGAQLLSSLVRARRTGQAEGPRVSFTRAWLASAAVLLSLHLTQELVEQVLGSGHPATDLLAHGGAFVVPLALALGAVVAVVLGAAHAVVSAVARRTRRHPRPALRLRARLPLLHAPAARACVLARHLAGRAPPLAS